MSEAPAPVRSDLLAGQAALVTGASSGLGRRFAETLAASGARVAVAARRLDRLEELVASIRAQGGEAFPVQLDVADSDAIPAAVDAAEAALGPISILVNNAGTANAKPSIEQEVRHLEKMLAVNVRGPFLLAREIAKRLIANGQPGRIVNIASIGAYNYDAKIPCAMYVATKSAVLRLTEALAIEWAKDRINVNAIAPGFFRSEMSEPVIEAKGAEWMASRMPRNRIGEPYQLDSTLLYLVSPASEFITGTCVKAEDAQMPR